MSNYWQELGVWKVVVDEQDAWRSLVKSQQHIAFCLLPCLDMNDWKKNWSGCFEDLVEFMAIHHYD